MDAAQWLTIGVSIVQILVVPVGCFRYILGVEKRLTRIEAKLGISD
ncbi:hypothetical protein BLA9940_01198 [Burkholderia aenigmatica]|nr:MULTISPECIES: hypothetical protein [Burkholderia cepacia complex]VWC47581.1 hypothetical protein BLA9940_01198 [Burkholderia aenigmatica]